MMKRSFFIPVMIVAGVSAAFAASTSGIQIKKTDGETLQVANADIKSLTFNGADAVITSASDDVLLIERDDIISVSPVGSVADAYTVCYSDDGVSVINPYPFLGVTTEIDGGYVTTTNTNVAQELAFVLTGSTADGSFLYNGDYKCTLELNGVTINSNRGAAVDIKCGKRIAVVLTAGTVSNLSDWADGDQKAALYFKGHPEFEKGGTLNVTGRCNHAISAKEYIQLKKSIGEINILSAANDGIHAGQYFQLNGGKVTISDVAGDGIQAEVTDDETDELNGQMIIKGGDVNITVQAPTADCLKADALISISGGTFNLTTTGDGIEDSTVASVPALYGPGGGWPGGGGGWPGGGGGSSVETSSPKCINGGGDIEITGGSITALSTGKGGKGIVCDGVLTIGGVDSNPEISCTTTGTAVTGTNDNASGKPKAIKAEGNIVINSGNVFCKTTQNGGEGIESKAQITINGGTVVCNTYDDGINAATKITVNGGVIWSWASNNDGMDCNGSQGFEFNGGIIVANGTNSPEEGFDCDNYSFVINGGAVLGVGGATSSVTKAAQPYAQTTGVSVTKTKYLSMVDASGNVLLSYLCPVSLSSATVVSSNPGYVNNSSCKLVYGVTSVSNPTESYLDGRILVGGTLTGGTSKSITPKTK